METELKATLENIFSKDDQTRILLVKHFQAGDLLLPGTLLTDASQTPVIPTAKTAVTLVKFFVRTNGPAPESPHPTAGTDVGMEVWLPDVTKWNDRIYCQIHGGFMGDFRITSTKHSSLPICTEYQTPELATELGHVVASTDGGHVADTVEDCQYLLNDDGSYNTEGWKNIAWQATHLLIVKTKEIVEAFYNRSAKFSYLFGCSTGGRQTYHSALKFPNDFNGLLVSCPSITQSLLFPAQGHAHIVINNDLGGKGFTREQLEVVCQKAIAADDTAITGQHDGYFTRWKENKYDPSKDPSILSVVDGGNCTEAWAFSKAQCDAINKIWYGPTRDGRIPDPAIDNGAAYQKPENQVWWGKIRGTRIDHSIIKRDIVGGYLALAFKDISLAPPSWKHPFGTGENAWAKWTHTQFAEAMLKCQEMDSKFEYMDADNPNLREFQQTGNKILTYHGLADTAVAPQSAIAYYHASAEFTGGMEKTADFHRLFLVPGMGHCMRSRGSAGNANIPLPPVEQLMDALIDWVEKGKAPDHIIAHSHDNKVSRPICMYPNLPKYDGKSDVNVATSFSI